MIPKLTEDLNIIQSLQDQPTISSSELKKQFDTAGNSIKTYLNNILTSYIDNLESNMATKEDNKKLKNELQKSLEEYKTELDNKFNAFKKEIQNSLDEVNNKIANVLKYDNFVVETYSHRTNYSPAQTVTISGTQSKEGYYPVCIAGFYQEHISIVMKGVYITSKGDNKVSYRAIATNSDWGNACNNVLTQIYILWVKK